MSLYGERIVSAYKMRPGQCPCALKQLLKRGSAERAEFNEDTLGISEKDVAKSNSLLVTDKRDSSIDSGYTLISKLIYFLAKQMLKTE